MLTRLDAVQGDQLLPVLPIVLAKNCTANIMGETSDYTRKGGVMYSEIMLPPHAPMAYADRQTLWNAVEKAERRHDAQLAYSFDIALQNELTFEGKSGGCQSVSSPVFCGRRDDRGFLCS